MNLYEYQAKKLFSQFNLPILKNRVFSDISEIKLHFFNIEYFSSPWVVKCQIRSGGRGKAGGVRTISSLPGILSFAEKWIGNRLITYQTDSNGEIVHSILIEPAVKIIHEFYLSVFIDRDSSQLICMTSMKGGIDIENMIQNSPDLIHKIYINPIFGPQPYQGRILACELGLSGIHINQFTNIYINTVNMFLKKDLMLVEINPLVITDSNKIFCLDAKVIIDQNALFRHPELLELYNDNITIANYPVSFSNEQLGINYVELDGNIGCMVNGAGLAMATIDLMKSLGGFPANFLDIGGDTNKNNIISALKMILKNVQVKAIFINIFGGIVCCDLVANSIIEALSESIINQRIPIVARLEGNNADIGSQRLIKSNLNIIINNNLIDAINQIIKLV